MRDNEKNVLKNIYKFQKWDNELFSDVWKYWKIFAFWNVGLTVGATSNQP